MKKQYTSPQFDYWCYISDKLCGGVGETLYATARKSLPGLHDVSSPISQG